LIRLKKFSFNSAGAIESNNVSMLQSINYKSSESDCIIKKWTLIRTYGYRSTMLALLFFY
jgi:hypothetical protein